MGPAKNQVWLVRLMDKLPNDMTLTIIGDDGPSRPTVEATVKELGLAPRVRLLGLQPREAVFHAFQQADLFVSPSVREGLPVAVLEAMAARMPVVLSDIGPHREVAAHGTSVPILPHEFDPWCQQIQAMWTAGQNERQRIGAQNRSIVMDHFSLARMHRDYSRLYEVLWQPSALALSSSATGTNRNDDTSRGDSLTSRKQNG
jgi:glycosyltransferase involved in cell wall biosynthesis